MSITAQIERARADCLERIEAFLIERGMPPATFGRLCMGDSAFVFRLREGRQMGPDVIDACNLFMSAYRPPRPTRRRRAGNAAVAA